MSAMTGGLLCHLSRQLCAAHRRSLSTRSNPQFGLCFDVDGVLARGLRPMPCTQAAMEMIVDKEGRFRVPVMFVTNSVSPDVKKAAVLSSILGVQVSPRQIVQAHGPVSLMTELHKKHCLVLGQGNITDLAKEVGFHDVCTIDDIRRSYPELDVMDHSYKFSLPDVIPHKTMKPIEAVLCLNEPIQWEGALQITTDVLTTGGQLEQPVRDAPQPPVIACNVDLQYMDRAHIPRYGNGAFLTCLEALFEGLTGQELTYTALSGKPSEMTFSYAEILLHGEAARLGYDSPIQTLYMFGDNPIADIVAANLYQRYLNLKKSCSSPVLPQVPACRQLPLYVDSSGNTVDSIHSVLVQTGVSQANGEQTGEQTVQPHKDFPESNEFLKPSYVFQDVHEALQHVLQMEGYLLP